MVRTSGVSSDPVEALSAASSSATVVGGHGVSALDARSTTSARNTAAIRASFFAESARLAALGPRLLDVFASAIINWRSAWAIRSISATRVPVASKNSTSGQSEYVRVDFRRAAPARSGTSPPVLKSSRKELCRS